MLEAIIYTLTSIDGIDNVIIKVEGEVLKELPNSKKSLPTSLSKDYGINKHYDLLNTNNVESYTVYYVSSYNNNEYYVPVTKYINNTIRFIYSVIYITLGIYITYAHSRACEEKISGK